MFQRSREESLKLVANIGAVRLLLESVILASVSGVLPAIAVIASGHGDNPISTLLLFVCMSIGIVAYYFLRIRKILINEKCHEDQMDDDESR